MFVVFPMIQYRSALCKADGDFPGFAKPAELGPSLLILKRDKNPSKPDANRRTKKSARPKARGKKVFWETYTNFWISSSCAALRSHTSLLVMSVGLFSMRTSFTPGQVTVLCHRVAGIL